MSHQIDVLLDLILVVLISLSSTGDRRLHRTVESFLRILLEVIADGRQGIFNLEGRKLRLRVRLYLSAQMELFVLLLCQNLLDVVVRLGFQRVQLVDRTEGFLIGNGASGYYPQGFRPLRFHDFLQLLGDGYALVVELVHLRLKSVHLLFVLQRLDLIQFYFFLVFLLEQVYF